MKITALDLGATTGVCYGEPHETPAFETWRLKAPTRGERGWLLQKHIAEHLESYRPDVLYIEEPARIAVMMDIGAQQDTVIAMHGYTMIAETIAAGHEIATKLVGVQRARQHFIGFRPKKGTGKEVIMARCRQLRWSPENTNESDAAAVWDFACALESPQAHVRAKLEQSVALSK